MLIERETSLHWGVPDKVMLDWRDDLPPLVPTSHISSEYANQPMGVRGNLNPWNRWAAQKFTKKTKVLKYRQKKHIISYLYKNTKVEKNRWSMLRERIWVSVIIYNLNAVDYWPITFERTPMACSFKMAFA